MYALPLEYSTEYLFTHSPAVNTPFSPISYEPVIFSMLSADTFNSFSPITYSPRGVILSLSAS